MTGSTPTKNKKARKPIGKIVALIIVISIGYYSWGYFKAAPADETPAVLATYTIARGDLVIDVLEAGSIESAESQVIRSKVEGKCTLISIIPEGTTLTAKDVEEKKILVQLDSADLRDKKTQQEITVQSAQANLTEASESLVIQEKTNESASKAGELKMKFALMDLEKYLGQSLAQQFLKEDSIPFGALIESVSLGGETLQKRRELNNTKLLEQIQDTIAKEKLDWTSKLSEKGFVSLNDLKVDELAVEKSKVALEKADTAIYLFKEYEFQKEAEKLKSDYEEAVRDMERIEAKNRSELAKAHAKLASASAVFRSQSDMLKKINEQIENCTVRATQPGLIVYANSSERMNDRVIEEGADVFERQELIKIPNTTTMLAKAKVHESMIARIKEGQKSVIIVDAMPDHVFDGSVKKVAILPDSGNRWMNPDIKVYQTDVSILQSDESLKPGMSAQVRIIVNELKDAIIAPVQAVETRGNTSYCTIVNGVKTEKRQVVTGDYNDKFVEIKEGLQVGEKVALLSAPSSPLPASRGEGKEMDAEKRQPGGEEGAKPGGEEGMRQGGERGERGERGPGQRPEGGRQRRRPEGMPPAGGPDGPPQAHKDGETPAVPKISGSTESLKVGKAPSDK